MYRGCVGVSLELDVCMGTLDSERSARNDRGSRNGKYVWYDG